MRILFVCTGNICRSPTAERLTAVYAAGLKSPDFHASSAGTRALIGRPMHPESAIVLEGLGGEASGFAARQLTSRIAASADLVLAMTRAHRDEVLELAPRKLRQTFVLSEAARLAAAFDLRDISELAGFRSQLKATDISDVPDPIGQNRESYELVGSQIAASLKPVLELCRRSAPCSGR